MWAGRGLQRAGPRGFYLLRTGSRVIISASYRTDIPAFCASRFMTRLRQPDCRLIGLREAE
jgi:hypothetical protein